MAYLYNRCTTHGQLPRQSLLMGANTHHSVGGRAAEPLDAWLSGSSIDFGNQHTQKRKEFKPISQSTSARHTPAASSQTKAGPPQRNQHVHHLAQLTVQRPPTHPCNPTGNPTASPMFQRRPLDRRQQITPVASIPTAVHPPGKQRRHRGDAALQHPIAFQGP